MRISTKVLNGLLNLTNVTIKTNLPLEFPGAAAATLGGKITVAADINWTSANSLTLLSDTGGIVFTDVGKITAPAARAVIIKTNGDIFLNLGSDIRLGASNSLLSISTTKGEYWVFGSVTVGGDLSMTTGNGMIYVAGQLKSGGSLTLATTNGYITAGSYDNDFKVMSSGGSLTLATGNGFISLSGGTFSSAGGIVFASANGQIDITGSATIRSSGDMTLAAYGSRIEISYSNLTSGGNLTIAGSGSHGSWLERSHLTSVGDLVVAATGNGYIELMKASLTSGGNLTVASLGGVRLYDSSMRSGGDLTLNSRVNFATHWGPSTVSSAGFLSVTSANRTQTARNTTVMLRELQEIYIDGKYTTERSKFFDGATEVTYRPNAPMIANLHFTNGKLQIRNRNLISAESDSLELTITPTDEQQPRNETPQAKIHLPGTDALTAMIQADAWQTFKSPARVNGGIIEISVGSSRAAITPNTVDGVGVGVGDGVVDGVGVGVTPPDLAPSPRSATPQVPSPAGSKPSAGIPVAATPAARIPVTATPVTATPAAGIPAAVTPVAGIPVAATPAAGIPAAEAGEDTTTPNTMVSHPPLDSPTPVPTLAATPTPPLSLNIVPVAVAVPMTPTIPQNPRSIFASNRNLLDLRNNRPHLPDLSGATVSYNNLTNYTLLQGSGMVISGTTRISMASDRPWTAANTPTIRLFKK